MKKRVFSILIAMLLLFAHATFPSSVRAANLDESHCYIASIPCPESYVEFAENNISKHVSAMLNASRITTISVGTPFSFTNETSNIYYFPVICDGKITYLFRVYSHGDSLFGALSPMLASEIEDLSHLTSATIPMHISMIEDQICATIGDTQYVLYEYPENSFATTFSHASYTAAPDLSIVDCKTNAGIVLDINQTRSYGRYIFLDISETQGSNSWCTAYCLATIIRTRTNFYTTAASCMIQATNGNYTTSTGFPWNKVDDVAAAYNLSPTVLYGTVSNSFIISEIQAGRPLIHSMQTSSGTKHSTVICGYSPSNTFHIWNPWYDFTETYDMNGPYVPTRHSTYYFYPYMDAYGF